MLNGSLYIPFKTNSDFLTESANYFNNSIFIVNRGLESLYLVANNLHNDPDFLENGLVPYFLKALSMFHINYSNN